MESKNRMESANILKNVIGIICGTFTKNKVALVCTGHANMTAELDEFMLMSIEKYFRDSNENLLLNSTLITNFY